MCRGSEVRAILLMMNATCRDAFTSEDQQWHPDFSGKSSQYFDNFLRKIEKFSAKRLQYFCPFRAFAPLTHIAQGTALGYGQIVLSGRQTIKIQQI